MVLGFSDTTFAQSSRELMNRINRLENDVETLSRSVYRGETPPPISVVRQPDTAASEVRFQQLETDMRTLTGRMEEQSYQIRQLQEQMEKFMADVTIRLNDLEGARNGASIGTNNSANLPINGNAGTPPSSSSSNIGINTQDKDTYQWSSGSGQRSDAGTPPMPNAANNNDLVNTPSAENLYQSAFAQLKSENYDAAQKQFEEFLERYPEDNLAGNAQYWLGETYYVRSNYEQAAKTFAAAYKKYPDNAKAPDNILKMGMSLAGMGRTDDACVALGQVESKYAAEAPSVMARAQKEMENLGCS